jgi:hypothetical protein
MTFALGESQLGDAQSSGEFVGYHLRREARDANLI